jgi:entericidin B
MNNISESLMRLPQFILPLIALIAITACETVQGAGRDVENLGETMTQESQQTQAEL